MHGYVDEGMEGSCCFGYEEVGGAESGEGRR